MLSSGAIDLLGSQPARSDCAGPSEVDTDLGHAQRLTADATFTDHDRHALRVTLTADAYPQWPDAFVLHWTFENDGIQPLAIDQFTAPQLELMNWPGELWSLQGAAVKWGQDFAFPLPADFRRDNFLGHEHHGEGGGIPIVYVWNQQHGLALMHIEPKPKDWFMPVETSASGVVHAAFENRQALRAAARPISAESARDRLAASRRFLRAIGVVSLSA